MSAVKQVIAINENEVARPEGTQARSVPVPAGIGDTSPQLVSPLRRRLPDERRAINHHFSVGGQEGYLTVGVYDDGLPGEIFLTMSKQGSTISGLMDSFATAGVARPPAWCLARSLVQQVYPRALRAQRVDGQSQNRLRQVHCRLHLSLA